MWCGPCNEEAKDTLNGLYAKYKPCGGEFLFQLAEGSAPGVVATVQNLTTWVKTYHVAYPSTLDAARQLFSRSTARTASPTAWSSTPTPCRESSTSPSRAIPDATFWGTFESLLRLAQCLASG